MVRNGRDQRSNKSNTEGAEESDSQKGCQVQKVRRSSFSKPEVETIIGTTGQALLRLQRSQAKWSHTSRQSQKGNLRRLAVLSVIQGEKRRKVCSEQAHLHHVWDWGPEKTWLFQEKRQSMRLGLKAALMEEPLLGGMYNSEGHVWSRFIQNWIVLESLDLLDLIYFVVLCLQVNIQTVFEKQVFLSVSCCC